MLAVLIDIAAGAEQLDRLIDGGLRHAQPPGDFDAVHDGQPVAQNEDAFEIVLFRLIVSAFFDGHDFSSRIW